MKTTITRNELKECVKNAIEKIIKESPKFDDGYKFGMEDEKHCTKKAKHGSMKPIRKEKGGANNKRWTEDDDEE